MILATFAWGRAEGAVFEIIALPDTENYTDATTGFPGILAAQTQWVVDNARTENIVFVTQLGDLIHHAPATEIIEANAGINTFDLPGQQIPYSVSAGNHELESTTSKSLVTQYFGPSRYAAYSWYRESYANFNHSQVFSAGGYEFLHLNLQKDPTPAILAWAQTMIDKNPGKPTIISTHDYLANDTARTTAGTAIWDTLVKKNPQIFLTLNGHTRPSPGVGVARMESTDLAGRKVLQVLQDFEDYTTQPLGATNSGYLRKIIFDTDNQTISFKTYSPTYAAVPWITDAAHQFSVNAAFLPQIGGTTLSPIFLSDAARVNGAGYVQDFESVPGAAGTALPRGWSVWQIAGTAATLTNTTGIEPTNMAAAVAANSTLLVADMAPTATWGNQAANVLGDSGRAVATNPGNNAAAVLQLKLVNGTAAPVQSMKINYDLAMPWASANDDGSELPGMAVFWSKTGSATAGDWTRLGYDTSVGEKGWTINLGATPLAPGSEVYLRWADDNVAGLAGEAGAENVWAVDNVRVAMTMVPQTGSLQWNGAAGDAKWTTATNWGGQNAVAGKQLVFGARQATETASNNDFVAGTVFGGVHFNSDAPSYELTGNPIALTGPVENQSSSDQSIRLDMELLAGAGTFENGGQKLLVSGAIGGAGPLVKTGEGTLVLSGRNTYTGGTVVEGGTLEIASDEALPADGDLVIHGGKVVLTTGLDHAVKVRGLRIELSPKAHAVPEPGTLALLVTGSGLLVFAVRRRRQAA